MNIICPYKDDVFFINKNGGECLGFFRNMVRLSTPNINDMLSGVLLHRFRSQIIESNYSYPLVPRGSH